MLLFFLKKTDDRLYLHIEFLLNMCTVNIPLIKYCFNIKKLFLNLEREKEREIQVCIFFQKAFKIC